MTTIIQQAQQAELALVAYADLAQGVPNPDSLINKAGLSSIQAEQFIKKYTVIDQYTHTQTYPITDPMTGEVIGTGTEYGLSVTVFEDKETGIRYLAVRGTDDFYDLATDLIDITMLGSSQYQTQYQMLKEKVQAGQAHGAGIFAVAGTKSDQGS